MQYIALLHKNTDSLPTADEWNRFIESAIASGMFAGGSAIGGRYAIGEKSVLDTTESVGGFMRFDSDNLERLLTLLNDCPVIRHGGTIELCEMPES